MRKHERSSKLKAPPRHLVAWTSLFAGVMVLVAASSVSQAADLRADATELVNDYRARLDELAEWCEGRGLAEQARETRSWLAPRDPYKLYVIQLSTKIGDSEVPKDAPADVAEFHRRLVRLKRDQANALYELAKRAILANRASLAFDLVIAALRENPDHDAIRRLLGYQSYRGEWHTAYEVDRLRKGQVWDDRFGWLPRAHVARYAAGERYCRGRWISAEEDAQLHLDIRNGWDIETEHYRIVTNHSIEAGVRLALKLEELYRVWKQLFLRYYATQEQVRALFAGSSRSSRVRLPLHKHEVAYFRDRDGYNQALRPIFSNIEITLGAYVSHSRPSRAYFFAGEEHDERTLLHEATHQLFHESRPVAASVGRDANFWIVEGVAMYMESLHTENGYHVLGGFQDDRIVAARYRVLQDNFYVPLSEFSEYGVEALQNDPRIRTLYSQAAGLTYFLIHYDGGRYRDALVEYLVAVYTGRDDPNTLARLAGASYAELDKQYRDYLESSLAGGE
jgi:hypothetical protein